jgi:RNA polymerase sigma-70 factor (ECF subfamily)
MEKTRATLLLRIRDRQDDAAWREFDSIYRPLLARVAGARGLNEADADDLVQHCLLAVQNQIRAFEYDPCKGRFRSWLCTLANNRVRNLRRGQRESPADSAVFAVVPDSGIGPDSDFERIWLEEHLRHGLAWLSTQTDVATFAAYRRYVIDQEEVSSVCADFGLTAQQLYKIKWRLTQMLRKWMRDTCGEEFDERPESA